MKWQRRIACAGATLLATLAARAETPTHAQHHHHAHAAGREHAHKAAHPVHHAPVAAAAAPVVAPPPAPPPPPDKGSNTGLPLPRYAALRADRVFMRIGPGERYPIQWVYQRRGLPVRIEREFDIWRLVEDSAGQKGWVHQATLVGQRTFVVPGAQEDTDVTAKPDAHGTITGRADARILSRVATQDEARAMRDVVPIRAQSSDGADITALLEAGTVGTLKACPAASDWCRVVVKGYGGWLRRDAVWGIAPGEVIGAQ